MTEVKRLHQEAKDLRRQLTGLPGQIVEEVSGRRASPTRGRGSPARKKERDMDVAYTGEAFQEALEAAPRAGSSSSSAVQEIVALLQDEVRLLGDEVQALRGLPKDLLRLRSDLTARISLLEAKHTVVSGQEGLRGLELPASGASCEAATAPGVSNAKKGNDGQATCLGDRVEQGDFAQMVVNSDAKQNESKNAMRSDHGSTDMEQIYALKCSVYDLLLICGGLPDPRSGFCGSLWAMCVTAFCLLLQLAFCIIIAETIAQSELNDVRLEGFAMWRMTEGHNVMYHDSVTNTSLVTRLCQQDQGLAVSAFQAHLYDVYNEYLPGLPGDRWPIAPGLCFGVMLLWILTLSREFHSVFSCAHAIVSLPLGGTTLISFDGNAYSIEAINTVRRACLIVFVAVPRFLISLFLCGIGTFYIVYTPEIEDIILNGIALAFILDLDEMLFELLVPKWQQLALSNTEPIGTRRITRWDRDITLRLLFTFVFLGASLPTVVLPHFKLLVEAQRLLCGGNQAFVYTVDKATGVVSTASTKDGLPPFQSLSGRYAFSAVFQRTTLEPTGLLESIESQIPVGRVYSTVDVRTVVGMVSESLLESTNNMPCRDGVGFNSTSGQHSNGSLLLALRQELGISHIQDCVDLQSKCNSPVVRRFCPETCGCQYVSKGMYFREGCSEQCEQIRARGFELEVNRDTFVGGNGKGSYVYAGRCWDYSSVAMDNNVDVLSFDARRFFGEVHQDMLLQGLIWKDGLNHWRWSSTVKESFGLRTRFNWKLTDTGVDLFAWYAASLEIASRATTPQASQWFTCLWVRSKYIDGDEWAGAVASPQECIERVKTLCPKATMAVIQGRGYGKCRCRYGESLTPYPGSYQVCDLRGDASTLAKPETSMALSLQGYASYQDKGWRLASPDLIISQIVNATRQQCADHCTLDKECRQFTYNVSSQACSLYAFPIVSGDEKFQGHVTYVKTPDPDGLLSAASWIPANSNCAFVHLVQAITGIDLCKGSSIRGSLHGMCKRTCGVCGDPRDEMTLQSNMEYLLKVQSTLGLNVMMAVSTRCEDYPGYDVKTCKQCHYESESALCMY